MSSQVEESEPGNQPQDQVISVVDSSPASAINETTQEEPSTQIVEVNKEDTPSRMIVRTGDIVTYCFRPDTEQKKTIQIVKGQTQPSMGIININAPLAQAFLGAMVGDEVDVLLPTGQKLAVIKNIAQALIE